MKSKKKTKCFFRIPHLVAVTFKSIPPSGLLKVRFDMSTNELAMLSYFLYDSNTLNGWMDRWIDG